MRGKVIGSANRFLAFDFRRHHAVSGDNVGLLTGCNSAPDTTSTKRNEEASKRPSFSALLGNAGARAASFGPCDANAGCRFALEIVITQFSNHEPTNAGAVAANAVFATIAGTRLAEGTSLAARRWATIEGRKAVQIGFAIH
jgi:hypothetical protein